MQKNVCALLLYVCAGRASAAYFLQDEYNSTNFFDSFDFFTGQDPTHGTVQYSSKDVATQYNLIATKASSLQGQEGTNNTYIAAHDGAFNRSLDVSVSRPSVRLVSKQKYTHGLFIADIVHLPVAECGVWPAFWTTNLNGSWPAGGEIDIIEGVNTQTHNQISLHTGSAGKCGISTDMTNFTGKVLNTDCSVASNPSGCSVTDSQAMSYGEAFNAAQGGVYAMKWTSDSINVYWWARRDIPQDVISGNPDPSAWAKPVASYSSASCDIDTLFQNHQIVFDITFCGEWAGQAAVWNQQCQTKYPGTCANHVMTSTDAFKETYWEVASLKVYHDIPQNISQQNTSPPSESLPAPIPSSIPPSASTDTSKKELKPRQYGPACAYQTAKSCTVKQAVIFQEVRAVISNSSVGAIQCLLNTMRNDGIFPTLWKAWPIDDSTVGVGFNIPDQTFNPATLLYSANLLKMEYQNAQDNLCTTVL